jgi:2'-5' RNA ligase
MAHKYVIVHMVEPGFPLQFSTHRWPLHLTLLINFSLPVSEDLFIQKLDKLAAKCKPFDVRLGDKAMFGSAGKVPVRLAEHQPKLQDLHDSLMTLATGLGASYDSDQFMGAAYHPHVTLHNRQLQRGYSFTLADVSLVDLAPDQNPRRRRVIKTIEFSAG